MEKLMKKITCIFTMLELVISMMTAAFANNVSDVRKDDGNMRENLTATLVSEEMGIGINLGNTLEAYYLDSTVRTGDWESGGKYDTGSATIGSNTPYNYETCWGAIYTTQKAVNGIKAAGFNTLRIPVYWGNMMENDGTFTINSEYIARVKEIVDYARNADMYVVINIHHYDEYLIRRYIETGTLEECAETFSHLWTQIAEYFKEYSDYVVFEGYNEYLGGGAYIREENGNVLTDSNGNVRIQSLSKEEGYKWTNTLNQAFVDAVRATGGNNAERVLICSGYNTNIDNTTSIKFFMPADTVKDRLMVSVHYVDNTMYWTNKIGSKEWEEYSVEQCELLKKAFTDNGIPVFVGECTAIYESDRYDSNATVSTESSDTLDYMLRLIKSYGFTPVLWDTNDNFYSRTDYKIKSDSDAAVIRTLAEELNTDIPTMEELTAAQEEFTQSQKEALANKNANNSKESDSSRPFVFGLSIIGVVILIIVIAIVSSIAIVTSRKD